MKCVNKYYMWSRRNNINVHDTVNYDVSGYSFPVYEKKFNWNMYPNEESLP